jgi:hypothetical protein
MKYLKYLPLALLCLFSIKFLIFPISYPEVIIIAALSTLVYFFQRVEKTEEIEKLEKRLNEIEVVLTETKRLNEDLKQSMSAMKVAAGFKPQQARGF